MKKLSFILSLLLVIGCEEEDDEKSAFVGTWTMTESSGGIYMMVNKAQYIKAGEVDGDVKATLYTDQGPVDSFSMTDFDVNQNMDGTFIMLSTPYDTNLPSNASYQLSDYVSSLDDYDYSQLNVNTMNDYYDFYNMSGNKQYSIETDDNGMNTVSVLDTLYRQIYINGNTVDDSSRYSIVSGTVKEVGTQIPANQPIEMMDDDIGLPSALTLTLNADFTGSVEETFEGNSMVAEIRWFATPDSLFGWNYCGLDGDDDECDGGPVFNNFKVTENSLVLGMYQDMCEEYDAMDGSGYCDEMMYDAYGVEIGTLDSFWAEINVSMIKSSSSKQYISTNQNLKLNKRSRSIFQEIAKQKRHIKNKRSVK